MVAFCIIMLWIIGLGAYGWWDYKHPFDHRARDLMWEDVDLFAETREVR